MAAPTGACWDVTSGRLLWVDGVHVHRDTEVFELPFPVGAARPRAGGGLVVTMADGVATVDPAGSRRWLVYWSREGVEAGDAAVDAAGRLVTSSGNWLVRVSPDGSVETLSTDLAADALCFSDSRLYVAAAGVVETFAYGDTLSDRRMLCRPGPSGRMCIDADDHLWVTLADRVVRYSPDGSPVASLPIAATSCCLGGDRYTDLYLTTTNGIHVEKDVAEGNPTPVFAT